LKDKILSFCPIILNNVIEKVTKGDKTYFRIVLSLDRIPIINRMYIDKSSKISDIFNTVKRITELEAMQKVLNYYIDKVKEESPIGKKEGEFKAYTNDQIKVLMEHGLDKNLTYSGVSRSKTPIEECDSYETRTMEFYISGFKSLSKVSDVINAVEAGGKLKPVMEMMEYQRQNILITVGNIDKPTVKLRKALTDLYDYCRGQLISNRNYLNCLKMAKVITGDWFSELVPNDKGEYEYSQDGLTMKAKVARERVYF
jgi:hypothetical protein